MDQVNTIAKSDSAEEENDDLPVGHVPTRREIFARAGVAGIALVAGLPLAKLLGTGVRAETGEPIDLVASPQVTEGPFFVDEKLNRSNLLEDTKRVTATSGLPLKLKLRIFDIKGRKGTPMEGAHVDIWHCDTAGVYSDESSNGIQAEDTKGEKWLRGYQVTDKNGTVTFDTIYPGWYQGRTVHIHFKVRRYSKTGQKSYEFTSQLFFDDMLTDTIFENAPYKARGKRHVRNTNDGIYQERTSEGTSAGSQLMLKPKKQKNDKGYGADFNIGIDLSKPQSHSFGGPDGPRRGPGGSGGPDDFWGPPFP